MLKYNECNKFWKSQGIRLQYTVAHILASLSRWREERESEREIWKEIKN